MDDINGIMSVFTAQPDVLYRKSSIATKWQGLPFHHAWDDGVREKIASSKTTKFLDMSRLLVSVEKNSNDEVMKHCTIGNIETVLKSCIGGVEVCEWVGLGMLQTSSFWPTLRITPIFCATNQMLVSDIKHMLTTIGQQIPCANSIRYYWSAC